MVVAAATVLRPEFGATFTRGTERALGTCLGVASPLPDLRASFATFERTCPHESDGSVNPGPIESRSPRGLRGSGEPNRGAGDQIVDRLRGPVVLTPL